MIGSLRGVLLHRSATEVLLEVGGVGYRCTVAPSTNASLGEIGADAFVHVHHHVREDANLLFGFAALDERLAFEALLGAHGVGPALALAILSVHAPDALRRVLADDDVNALCLVPGVGKKTAARLMIELKSRLDVPELADAVVARNGSSPGPPDLTPRSEVREALAGLGYEGDEIRRALAALPDDDADLDTPALLKLALRALSAR